MLGQIVNVASSKVHRYGSRMPANVRAALDDYLSEPRGTPSDVGIAAALRARFGAEAPSADTVKRVRRERSRAPADVEWSLPDPDMPPEALGRVLEVLAVVIEQSPMRRSLTRDEAAAIAQLAAATIGIDPWVLFRLVRRLLSAHAAGDQRGVDAIHHYIAFRAWTREGEQRYRAVYRARHVGQLLSMTDAVESLESGSKGDPGRFLPLGQPVVETRDSTTGGSSHAQE